MFYRNRFDLIRKLVLVYQMKKQIILTCLTCVGVVVGAQAQYTLASTAWQGTVQLYRVMDIVLQFDKDTIRMYSVPDNVLAETKLLETMTYTTKGDTFTWKKVSGGSPCDTETPGTWRYTISRNKMTLNVVDDACEARAGAHARVTFKKVAFRVK